MHDLGNNKKGEITMKIEMFNHHKNKDVNETTVTTGEPCPCGCSPDHWIAIESDCIGAGGDVISIHGSKHEIDMTCNTLRSLGIKIRTVNMEKIKQVQP